MPSALSLLSFTLFLKELGIAIVVDVGRGYGDNTTEGLRLLKEALQIIQCREKERVCKMAAVF